MGQKIITLKMPTDFTKGDLKRKIGKKCRIKDFTFQLEGKSLDARHKSHIHWLIRALVISEEIKEEIPLTNVELNIPYKKRNKNVVIVGSGPAGFFAAYVLQMAGFNTILIERGSEIEKRSKSIIDFEKTSVFTSENNYAFGEGGAGTFSDGKLTSRSKHISLERKFIIKTYIEAGAPKEIKYLAHPHLGSDNLKMIVKELRAKYTEIGGVINFDTKLMDVKIRDGKVKSVETNSGVKDTNVLVLAIGHSAYETYRMLMQKGLLFRIKNFALGCRMEHPQQIINLAQWGKESLPGVKAAEYRLSSKADGKQQVYSFCMCPGGVIVPANAYPNSNIVNGMSLYNRDAKFANAACVAGVNLSDLLDREVSASEALDWLEQMEHSFYKHSDSYQAPSCSISDFVNKRQPKSNSETSYPFGLIPAPLWEMLPEKVSNSMREGLKDFSRKMKGFETGNLIGLESKSSAIIQVLRSRSGLCEGFENFYMLGEGSGYAGGIISSAADGIKGAMNIIAQFE